MLYDPGGGNELAPLDDFGRQDRGALNTGFRVRGRACVRPWKLGARAYSGRRRPGVGPRNAYALVSGMRLGQQDGGLTKK